MTALVVYCLGYRRWRKRKSRFSKKASRKINHRKQVVTHPAVPVVNQALKQIRDVFLKQFAAAKTDEERVALARTLAETASDNKAPAADPHV